MCGLFGFSGPSAVNIEKIKLGLLDNIPRGTHSCGIYGRKVYKSTKGPSEFIREDKQLRSVMEGQKLVLAHNRYATMGAHTTENAHPFELPNCVGTHNGFLVNMEMISEKYDVELKGIDSLLLYEVLEKTGFDYDCLKDIYGSVALAYEKDGLLHLYRRENRPLFLAETPEGLYYGSRKEGLEMIGASNVVELPVHQMYVIKEGIIQEIHDVEEPALYVGSHISPKTWRTQLPNSYKLVPKTKAELEAEKKRQAPTKTHYPQRSSAASTTMSSQAAGTQKSLPMKSGEESTSSSTSFTAQSGHTGTTPTNEVDITQAGTASTTEGTMIDIPGKGKAREVYANLVSSQSMDGSLSFGSLSVKVREGDTLTPVHGARVYRGDLQSTQHITGNKGTVDSMLIRLNDTVQGVKLMIEYEGELFITNVIYPSYKRKYEYVINLPEIGEDEDFEGSYTSSVDSCIEGIYEMSELMSIVVSKIDSVDKADHDTVNEYAIEAMDTMNWIKQAAERMSERLHKRFFSDLLEYEQLLTEAQAQGIVEQEDVVDILDMRQFSN